MKAVTKKAVSILLTVIIALGAIMPFGLHEFGFSITAHAAEASGYCGPTANGADEKNLQWSFYTATGVLSITGMGAMCVGEKGEDIPWSAYREAIREVQLANGITSIGDYAFASCKLITSVVIPESVTSIGDYAFVNCFALEKINIPDRVTRIGKTTFASCESLESVVISPGVTEIAAFAFASSGLKSIVIPSNVKKISGTAFQRSANLETLIFEEGIESIGGSAFSCCTSLREVELPASLTNLGDGVFTECCDLEITVNEGNKNFCSIDNVIFSADKSELLYFSVFSGQTSYIVPEGVTRIAPYAFTSAPDLVALTIPDTLQVIGEWAFCECYIDYCYYTGSEEQWNSTLKQYFRDLETVFFNCAPDYAHYDGIKMHELEIVAGENMKAELSVVPQGNVNWRSKNSEIATVDETGRISAMKGASLRKALVYAEVEGFGITDIYQVNVQTTQVENDMIFIFGNAVTITAFLYIAMAFIFSVFMLFQT